MPLPPLGDRPLPETLPLAFDLLDGLNKGKSTGRIENFDFSDMASVDRRAFSFFVKSWDYLYDREKLTGLRGDAYKVKRWAVNRFIKNVRYETRPFVPGDLTECLALYDAWKREKERAFVKGDDDYPRFLMEDSRIAHERMMKESSALGIIGKVVTLDSKISAYTFGMKMGEEMLVILAEIADRSVPGLAQFIFREFCAGFPERAWVNTMDDSDLPALRKVKFSYHPVLLVPSFSLMRLKAGDR